jgi:hypothetical protein
MAVIRPKFMLGTRFLHTVAAATWSVIQLLKTV